MDDRLKYVFHFPGFMIVGDLMGESPSTQHAEIRPSCKVSILLLLTKIEPIWMSMRYEIVS